MLALRYVLTGFVLVASLHGAAYGQAQYRAPFETGEDLITGIEHAELAERYAAAVFINATLHALKSGYVMGVSKVTGGDMSKAPPWEICMSGEIPLGTVVKMVTSYVKRRPAVRTEDSQRVIYKAALESYPCKK